MREKSEELFKRASKHLVGGVNSPVRAFNSVGGNPLFIESAKGSIITDVDGNDYVDLVGSYGPMILGHQHPKVQEAVETAIHKGYSYGATSEGEIELAEIVTDAIPSMDMIRFVNSGTEAVLSAIRLSRAYTGRNKIIKFAGCYHGHSDALLVAAGSGVATLSLPGSAGVPEDAVKHTLIANYNDIESVITHFHQYPDDIAGVFIEPVAGNMGVVTPDMNFLKELREITQRHGAMLVYDEVMSGFRENYGGAQNTFKIEPDITCLGKVIGGGFPVGAYGARKEIMETVAPLGNMYQAGTLSGNPVAMAAGIATLKTLKESDPYPQFKEWASQLQDAFLQEANDAGVAIAVNKFGSMINPFFTEGPVTDFESAKKADTEMFSKFFWGLTDNGVYIPPSQFESWFLPASLNKDELSKVKKAIKNAFKQI